LEQLLSQELHRFNLAWQSKPLPPESRWRAAEIELLVCKKVLIGKRAKGIAGLSGRARACLRAIVAIQQTLEDRRLGQKTPLLGPSYFSGKPIPLKVRRCRGRILHRKIIFSGQTKKPGSHASQKHR